MSIDIRTKYVFPDDIKVYCGIDLSVELKNDGNPSNTVQAFMKRIEDTVATMINYLYFKNVDNEWGTFTKEQKEKYAKALCYQVMYVFKNGDLLNDSFLDFEKGTITSRAEQFNRWLHPVAQALLHEVGLITRKVTQRRFGLRL